MPVSVDCLSLFFFIFMFIFSILSQQFWSLLTFSSNRFQKFKKTTLSKRQALNYMQVFFIYWFENSFNMFISFGWFFWAWITIVSIFLRFYFHKVKSQAESVVACGQLLTMKEHSVIEQPRAEGCVELYAQFIQLYAAS